MNEKLNFAIIGCGTIAERHANAIQHVGNLIIVYDPDLPTAQKLADKYNCAVATQLDALTYENIDIVSICTPNWLHASQAISYLKKGLHVVCEKPMAINVADALEMNIASQENEKELFIVKQLRHYPNIVLLKNWIEENQEAIKSFEINCLWNREKDYYKNWRGVQKTDGGTLYTQFSHYIDLLLWLFGSVKSFKFTSANQQHPYIEFEDCGTVELEMVSGVKGIFNYSVNATKHDIQNSIRVSTKKA